MNIPQIPQIPSVPLVRLETLWMQIGGTLCNLSCTHCFISCGPKNHSHAMMSLQKVRQLLEEAHGLGTKEYYITGGEVFLNPEIMEILSAILEYGPLGILTNGTLITSEKAEKLRAIQDQRQQAMQFRISMESFDETDNNKIRGNNSYRLALAGIRNLAEYGFSPILTVTRTWDEEQDHEMEKKFRGLLQENGVIQPRVKILPGFLIGRLAETQRPYAEDEKVSEKCFENYDITSLQCATSRMATGKGVYICPILVDHEQALMGQTLKETLRPYPLAHPACYTCRVSGMTCKNP